MSLDETEAVVDAMARLHTAYRQSPVLEGFTPIGQLSPATSALGVAIRRRLLGNESGPTAGLIPARLRSAGIEADLEDQWDLYRAGVSEIFRTARGMAGSYRVGTRRNTGTSRPARFW